MSQQACDSHITLYNPLSMTGLNAKWSFLRGENWGLLSTARFVPLLVAGAFASFGSTPCNDAFAEEPPPMGTPALAMQISPVDLFSKMAPTVVKLIVQGEGGGVVCSGSGFVVAAPSSTICHVITNYHVIRAASNVNVEFHDGSVAGVRDVLSEDPALDLAILRVELVKPREELAQFILDIQNGVQPPIGTRLFAIGSPMGMKNTLSDGLLSGYRSEGSQASWIQITNPISPGSSGGPVFTGSGSFVGVTTASLPDAQNLNFAISAKKVQDFVAREKVARPLWKGSCITCEEYEFLLKFYGEVFERFRRQNANLELRPAHDWRDVLMWTMGIVYDSLTQRFLEFCKTEAIAGDRNAIVLMAYFQLGAARLTNSERIARINEAATLLKQALPRAGDDTFFILLCIAKAQVSLGGALGAAGALQQEGWGRLLDDAIRTFEAARELSPQFAPTLFELSRSLVDRGRLSDALRVSTQLVLLVPNSPVAHAQRADIFRSLGSKLAAIDELRIACDLNPYGEFAFMELGGLYTETGQYEKAIEAYRRGLDAGSRLAAASPRNNDDSPELDAANAEYNKVVSRATFAWQLHCSIARALVALKRYDEAVEAYRRALDAAGDGAGPENRAMLEQELATCRAAVRRP